MQLGDIVTAVDGSYSMELLDGHWTADTRPAHGARALEQWRIIAVNAVLPTKNSPTYVSKNSVLLESVALGRNRMLATQPRCVQLAPSVPLTIEERLAKLEARVDRLGG